MGVWRRALACLVALALVMPVALLAQPLASPGPFRPERLEQIVAPIALYPDPLLAQVLMAATYPLEVVQAARFVQANPTLKGDALNEALKAQIWDDSVKSLVAFPQVLRMMDEKLDWTQRLGDAFLGQQQELMDAVQRLRARAQAQGTLKTTPQQTVTVEPAPPPPPPPPGQPPPPPDLIQIEPANPQVVYVPIYDPAVVYGPWPYGAYPPEYYYPPGWAIGGAFFTFGVGVVIGAPLWAACDWHHHTVVIDVGRYHPFTRVVNPEGRRGDLERGRGQPRDGDRLRWEHDPWHRRGVDYRTEPTRQRFGRPGPAEPRAREEFRGRAEQGRQELGQGSVERFRQGMSVGPRLEPGQGSVERFRQGTSVGPRLEPGRSQPGGPGRVESSRPSGPALGQRREPGVFQGLGGGGDERTFRNRGRESRQRIAPPPSPRSAPPRGAPGGGAQGGGPHGKGAPGGGRRR